MKNMKRSVALLVAIALLIGCAAGGTMAWLVDTTTDVTNTFVAGNIDIELDEADDLDLKMVPGSTIEKDPVITVKGKSEACWLFVKVTKSANFDNYMTYAIADGWTAVAGNEGVYSREVAYSESDQEFSVLKGNIVTVKENVTKELMDNAEMDSPTLAFKAYAVQKENISTVADAWAKVTP